MNINFDPFSIIYLVIGILASSICFMLYISKLKKEIKSIKRQYEKKSVGMDDSALRVKTLENKIKTLEIALKKQMEKE